MSENGENVLFCAQPKDIQFTVREEEKLEKEHFYFDFFF